MEAKIAPDLEPLAVPIDSVTLHPKNPRRGDVPLLKASLTRFGQYKTITVQAGTGLVLTGNHTLRAARELGWDRIAKATIMVDDAEANALVLADNGTSDLSVYDDRELAALIRATPDLTATGITPERIAALEQEPIEADEGADDVPDLPEPVKVQTRPGDVWILGEHRLICGDATDPRVVEALMGADKADLMWTDPPYGVEYEGKTKEKLRIQNDGKWSLATLLKGAFEAAADVLKPGAPVYVAHADTERITFETSLRDSGFLVRQNLIWVKNTMVLGHSDYHYKHEPILEGELAEAGEGKGHDPLLYGFREGGTGRLGRGGAKWKGANNATTVFEFPKPAASVKHPTMKPVNLILAMFANSLRYGGMVFDPFAGSGSTLLAAELHNESVARVIELDPRYCDVICHRYLEQVPGGQVVRESDGAEFEAEV